MPCPMAELYRFALTISFTGKGGAANGFKTNCHNIAGYCDIGLAQLYFALFINFFSSMKKAFFLLIFENIIKKELR